MTTDNTNDVKPPEVNLNEELERLKSESKAKEAELQKMKSTEQGLRGSLQEKDRQLKEQTSLRDEITSLRDSQKIFAAMLAEKGLDKRPEGK